MSVFLLSLPSVPAPSPSSPSLFKKGFVFPDTKNEGNKVILFKGIVGKREVDEGKVAIVMTGASSLLWVSVRIKD